jgi:PAS domain S-box-containing protein
MSDGDFQLYGIRDPRLAERATSDRPAWLWSVDGARVLWANTVGARLFGARNAAELAGRTIGPADPHRRQVARLAGRLAPNGAARLERLRGFGAPLGRLVTCACARLSFPDGVTGILVAAAEAVGRPVPLDDRLAHLVAGVPRPAMVFTPDGALAGANEAAATFAGQLASLAGPGLDEARTAALAEGQATLQFEFGRVTLHRVGANGEVALVALIDAVIVPQQPAPVPPPVIVHDIDATPEPPHASAPDAEPPLPEGEAVSLPPAVENAAAAQPQAVVAPALDADHDAPPPADRPQADTAHTTAHISATLSEMDGPPPGARRHPLRFMWQMDDNGRFSLGSDEFTRLIGTRTAAAFGRLWREIADELGLDPEDRITAAIATRDTWSGIVVHWPADGTGARLPVEMSGLPVYDRDGGFIGYRGFGVCRDLDGLARLAAQRRDDVLNAPPPREPSPVEAEPPPADVIDALPPPADERTTVVDTPLNVVPFPSPAEPKAPALTAGESSAFDELARRLSARLESGEVAGVAPPPMDDVTEAAEAAPVAAEPAVSPPGPEHPPALSLPESLDAEPDEAPEDDDTTEAEELATILDTTAEGVVIVDEAGRILSCNRSAEALFGHADGEIAGLGLVDLFAPESQRAALDYLESVTTAGVAGLLEHGREMLGRVRDGGTIPLSMTMGRTRPGGARFFAIFRDLSQIKKNESELAQARRQAERSMTAKADILSRISHEVRMPLNAIIGFADVMIEERFGPLGNERYVEYMKDIRASGQHVMTIIDDLLDLSRIETGKMELSFANQDLNSLVEQCVAVMQPQANRERIIIRSSLAHALPAVKADARALRQIALNLIGSSIHLANPGGQVIVSTAITDFGDVALRVRDTGPGLNDNEIAAALEPFRTPPPTDRTSDTAAISLSLTKALVEANRARFNIKTAPHSGTLIEVVFSHASAIA